VTRIREELLRSDRKFTFLCGHDSNLASLSSALRLQLPETENAIEVHTPIGSKIVFEKWTDGTEDFVAINLVYQSVSQLQGCKLLSLDQPPMVMPITVEGLTANSDGLYPLADFDARMEETQAEYDAIADIPSAIRATPSVTQGSNRVYLLNGIQASDNTQGVIIKDNRKAIRGTYGH